MMVVGLDTQNYLGLVIINSFTMQEYKEPEEMQWVGEYSRVVE